MPEVATKRNGKVKPPTQEIGNISGIPVLNLLSWSQLASISGSPTETVPDLQFPMSAMTYSRMRNDAQVNGLLRGTMLPITRYEWYINPNGADDTVVEKIADDLGLPIDGDDPNRPKRRSKRRFNFQEHLRIALLALAYGFYMFEQVFEYRESSQLLHLRKLAERPPWSIAEINSEKDGGLKEIRQNTGPHDPPIPVDHLVAYVWDKEGGNWTGRSLLRSCYGPWLIKDRVIKVGAINIERNGAGTPIIEAPPGADKTEIQWLDALARAFRAGSSAGGAIPHGTKLRLQGVEGTQPDSVGFMRFLNEEMARSFLMMFMQLSQTSSGQGSYALGESWIDWFKLSQEAIAEWFIGTFNEHQIEDDVDWNFGEEEPAPLLAYRVPENEAPTQSLADEIDDGEVEVDEETEELVKEGVEAKSRRTSRRTRAASGRNSRERRGRAVAGAESASPVPLPDRPLRRQPYEHEVQAATDFAAIDVAFNSNLDLLFMDVTALIGRQVDELHDWIVEAGGDLDSLTEISASPEHEYVIGSRLRQAAELAAQQAVDEARSQGIVLDRPDLEDLTDSLNERARVIDAMITRDVTAAATRAAIRLTGGGLSATEVADQVRDDLRGRTWSGIKDQLGGAITSAVNSGRGIVFRRDDEPGRLYSSELLDANTCANCRAIDGTNYENMDDAERDYPTGGFKDCQGRERCRGLVVKVYSTETPPTLMEPGA